MSLLLSSGRWLHHGRHWILLARRGQGCHWCGKDRAPTVLHCGAPSGLQECCLRHRWLLCLLSVPLGCWLHRRCGLLLKCMLAGLQVLSAIDHHMNSFSMYRKSIGTCEGPPENETLPRVCSGRYDSGWINSWFMFDVLSKVRKEAADGLED